MTKAKQNARAKARKKTEAQAALKVSADRFHIVVVGELETYAYTMYRDDINKAGKSIPKSKVGTDELVTQMGAGLAVPDLLVHVHGNTESFCMTVAAYVSRTSSFKMMASNGTNTLIFSVFKSAPPGDFQTRIAGMTTLANVDREYKDAAELLIATNPHYLKDRYDPSS
jgi:hypothetical protein